MKLIIQSIYLIILMGFSTTLLKGQCAVTINHNATPMACAPVQVQFSTTPTNPNWTYTWDFDGGNGNTSAASPTCTFDEIYTGSNPTQIYNVSVIVDNGQGCSDTVSTSITIRTRPDPVLLGNKEECDTLLPFTVSLSDNTTLSPVSWLTHYSIDWDANSITTPQVDFNSTTPPLSETCTYDPGLYPLVYSVTADNGCVDSTGYTIINIASPKIDISSPIGNPIGCGPKNLCFNIGGFQANDVSTIYEVDFGDGTIETHNHPPPPQVCHIYDSTSCLSPNEEFIFEIRAINICKTSRVSFAPIEIYTGPAPNFTTPNGLFECVNTTVSFNNISDAGYDNNCTEENTLYRWVFGTNVGDTIIRPNKSSVTKFYNASGTYSVQLCAWNFCDTVCIQKDITIVEFPVANFSYTLSNSDTCAPFTLTTNNASTGAGLSYLWTLRNTTPHPDIITTSIEENPSFNVTDAGNYTLTLRTNNVCGNDQITKSFTVKSPPSISFNPPPATCDSITIDPNTYIEVDSNGTNLNTINWTFTGGIPASFSGRNPPPITFYANGTSPIIRVVTANDCGTADSTFTLGTVLSSPQANASVSLSQACLVDTTFLNIINNSVGDNLSFQWRLYKISNNSLLDQSSDTIPNFFVTQTGDYRIRLFINSGTCGNDVWQDTISVTTSPSVSVTLNPTPNYCDTVALYPVASVDSIGTTYNWSFPGGTPSSSTFANPGPIYYNVVDTFDVSLSITTSCGTATDTKQFIIHETPQVNAGQDIVVCNNAPIQTLNGLPSGGSWSSFPFVNTSNNTFNPANLNAGTVYTLIYTINNLGCINRDTLTITVNGVQVNAGSNQTLCIGQSAVTLTGTPANGVWSSNGSTNTITSNGTYNPVNQATDVLTYTYTDPVTGCVASDNVTITVDNLPTPTFTVPSIVCEDIPININNTTIGSATQFTWKVDGVVVSNSANPSIVLPNCNQNATIQLITGNPNGCQDSTEQIVFVECRPTIGFDMDTTIGCADLTIQFTNLSTGTNLQYEWIFDTLGMSNDTNPTFTFPEGINDTSAYIVTLNVTNECGTFTTQDTVWVIDRPRAAFGTDFNEGCSPLRINISNVDTINTTSYFWDMGNGNSYATLFPPEQIYTTTDKDTIYVIMLVATNHCGSDTLRDSILVKPNNINSFFNTSVTEGCEPLTVQLIDFTTSVTQVEWNLGDVVNGSPVITTGDTISYTYSEGIYTIEEYVTNGCSQDTSEVTITVHPSPSVSFVPIDTTVCVGDTIIFQTTSDATVVGYNYNFGEGNTSFIPSPSHAYDSSGIFTVELEGTSNLQGCTAFAQGTVNIEPLPTVDFSLSSTAGCIPFVVQVNSIHNASFYNWEVVELPNSGRITNTATYTFNTQGTYTIRLTAEGSNGCTQSIEKQITVYPPVTSDFTYNIDTSCNLPDTVCVTNLSTDGIVWDWTLSGASSGTFSNFEDCFIATNAGSHTIELITQNQYQCADTSTQTFTIRPYPTVDIGLSNIRDCLPLTTSFMNTSVGDEFLWIFDNQMDTSRLVVPMGYTYDSIGLYDLYFSSTDTTNGCVADTTIRIDVGPAAMSAFSYTIDASCNLPDTLCVINESIADTSWSWNILGAVPSVSTQENDCFIINNAGTYDIQLIVDNSYGCPDTSIQTFTIRPYPTVDIGLSNIRDCLPLTTSFTNTSVGDEFSWVFDNQMDTSRLVVPMDYIYNDVGLYDLYFSSTDTTNGCVADTTIRIDVGPAAVSAFSYTIDESCNLPDTLCVTNESIADTSWSWSVLGAVPSVSTQENDCFIINNAGTYDVQLIVDNSYGCPDTSIQTFTIRPYPTVDIGLSNIRDCLPLTTSFTNTSVGDEFLWVFDNQMDTSRLVVPMDYLYDSAGLYNLYFSSTDTTNGCVADTTIRIDVGPAAISAFSYTIDESCNLPDTLCVTNESIADTSWSWSVLGAVPSVSTQENDCFIINNSGTYDIQLIVDNSYGCADTSTQTFTIRPYPTVDIGLSNIRDCLPLTTSLTNTSIGDEFLWIFDNQMDTSRLVVPMDYLYDSAGLYNLYFSSTDTSNGCVADTTITIDVGPAVLSAFSSVINDSCMIPSTVNFLNESGGATDYLWQIGTTILTNTNLNYQFNNGGTHTIQLIANNDYNCPDTSEQEIFLYPASFANFDILQLDPCSPSLTEFANTSQFYTESYWYENGNLFSTATNSFQYLTNPNPIEQEAVSIKLVVNQDNICFDSITQEVMVFPQPQAAFTFAQLGNGLIQFFNQSITDTNSTFFWDYGDGDFSTDFEGEHRYELNGDKTVRLIVTNAFGCSDTAEIFLPLNAFFWITVPNAFSPESSGGETAVFKPKGVGLQSYRLRIFTQKGQLVYETTTIENERPTEPWDGRHYKTKEPLPLGVYLWTIDATFINGITWGDCKTGNCKTEGSLMLLR